MPKSKPAMSVVLHLYLFLYCVNCAPQPKPKSFTTRDVSIQTASCTSSSRILSLEMFQTVAESNSTQYLARWSARQQRVRRRPGAEPTLAARGNSQTGANLSISIAVPSTSFSMHHDEVTFCKYTYDVNDQSEIPASTAEDAAKMFEWSFEKLPQFQSAHVEVHTTGHEVFEFDSDKQKVNSLEFYKPLDGSDVTMYLWLETDDVMRLQVFASLDSELVKMADNFECQVKVGNVVMKCAPFTGMNSSLSEPCFLDWAIALPTCLLLAVVFAVSLFCYCRKTRNHPSHDSAVNYSRDLLGKGGVDAKKGEEEEEERMRDPIIFA